MPQAIDWTHSDSIILYDRLQMALDRSIAHKWGEGDLQTRGAEMRALAMGTCLVAKRCFDPKPYLSPEEIVYDFSLPDEWPSPAHHQAAALVLNTLPLLSGNQKPISPKLITIGGGTPATMPVEGWPILLARVVGTAIWAYAACWIAERYEDTIDRLLARKALGDKLMEAQAKSLQTLENHANLEAKLGKTLAYAPEEKAVLNTLLENQKKWSEQGDPPKDNLAPLGDTTSSLGLAGLLILGLGGYLLLKGR